MPDFPELILLTAIFVSAGLIKGVFGLGMPAFLIGLLTLFYEPRAALAMILVAITLTNVRQAFRGGPILALVKRHWVVIALACLINFSIAFLGAEVSTSTLFIYVGIAMVIFAITSLIKDVPALPDRWLLPAQIITGLVAGGLGGISAIWAPPLAIYLLSLKLERDVFVQSLGVLFLIQALSLAGGFIASGALTGGTAILGVILTIPGFVGLFLGERLRSRFSNQNFVKGFLLIFLLLGLNMIRRGLFVV